MQEIAFFIHISAVILSAFASIYYAIKNYKDSLIKKLIALLFLVITYILFVNFLTINNLLSQFPHLIRTGFLAVFIVPSLTYLVVDFGILRDRQKEKLALLFLPPILYFINYASFFFSSAQKKLSLLNQTINWFNEGTIISHHGVVFMFLIHNSITIRFLLLKRNLIKKQNIASNNRLLNTFLAYLFLHFLPIALIVFQYNDNHKIDGLFYILYSLANIYFFFYILTTPEWLFAENQAPTKSTHLQENTEHPSFHKEKRKQLQDKLTPNKENLHPKELELLKKILRKIEINKLYLKDNFSQKVLATTLKVSEYKLRLVIEKAYQMNFVEFSNHLKIIYMIDEMEQNKQWKYYTMQAISEKLGYKSINSLYLNFKKIMGYTPGEYFNLKKDSSSL